MTLAHCGSGYMKTNLFSVIFGSPMKTAISRFSFVLVHYNAAHDNIHRCLAHWSCTAWKRSTHTTNSSHDVENRWIRNLICFPIYNIHKMYKTRHNRAKAFSRSWHRQTNCLIFSARCNIYISHFCYDIGVRLSVTEVHWRIIANLGFKFRSTFTAHCGLGER